MNFIAGYLILITKNEEESFWLLDALVGRILPGRLKVLFAPPRPTSGVFEKVWLTGQDGVKWRRCKAGVEPFLAFVKEGRQVLGLIPNTREREKRRGRNAVKAWLVSVLSAKGHVSSWSLPCVCGHCVVELTTHEPHGPDVFTEFVRTQHSVDRCCCFVCWKSFSHLSAF